MQSCCSQLAEAAQNVVQATDNTKRAADSLLQAGQDFTKHQQATNEVGSCCGCWFMVIDLVHAPRAASVALFCRVFALEQCVSHVSMPSSFQRSLCRRGCVPAMMLLPVACLIVLHTAVCPSLSQELAEVTGQRDALLLVVVFAHCVFKVAATTWIQMMAEVKVSVVWWQRSVKATGTSMQCTCVCHTWLSAAAAGDSVMRPML